jgi:hypothetical protein
MTQLTLTDHVSAVQQKINTPQFAYSDKTGLKLRKEYRRTSENQRCATDPAQVFHILLVPNSSLNQ